MVLLASVSARPGDDNGEVLIQPSCGSNGNVSGDWQGGHSGGD